MVPIELRVLTDTVIVRADVKPSEYGVLPVEWLGTLDDGIAVISSPLPNQGDSVAEGEVVAEISGRPIFLMAGSVPIWRRLEPGAQGSDVANLQAFLRRLGAAIDDQEGHFGPDTAMAVAELYRSNGYPVVVAGSQEASAIEHALQEVESARDGLRQSQRALRDASAGAPNSAILEAEAEVRSARRDVENVRIQNEALLAQANAEVAAAEDRLARLNAEADPDPDELADAELALTTAAGNREIAIATADSALASARDRVGIVEQRLRELRTPPDVSAARDAVAASQRQLTSAEERYDALVATAGGAVPFGEILVIDATPAYVASVTARLGSRVDGSFITLASSELIVEALLDVQAASLVDVGAPVLLSAEATGTSATGVVVSVADIPKTTEQGRSGYQTIIAVPEGLDPAWLGLNVRVTIADAEAGEATLVVPESALYTQADGSTRVVIQLDDGSYMEVNVQVEFTAAGFASIAASDNRVREGALVVVSGDWRGAQPTGGG